MRIESVTASSFGPFANSRLDFAPGMNVLHGPNEVGKSSWHGALYLGLCGLRRGRGRNSVNDDLTRRHRPWDNAARWGVSLVLRLDDGRTMALEQDLNSRTGKAIDSVQGRDYTHEIIHDNAPDGARWLGLNRDTFLSTACVRQVSIQAVTQSAAALQDDLQRAAANAGVGETAADALARLDSFRREHVGLDRANSRRPLRAARDRLQELRDDLEDAKREQRRYADLRAEADELARKASSALMDVRLAEAALRLRQAETAESRYERARAIAVRIPVEPSRPSEGDEQANAVESALQAWREMPPPADLSGRSAAEIRDEMNSLPPMPEGDTEPRVSVREAFAAYQEAVTKRRLHREQEPRASAGDLSGGLTSGQLDELAVALSAAPTEVSAEVQARYDRARARVEELAEGRGGEASVPWWMVVWNPLNWLRFLCNLFSGQSKLAKAEFDAAREEAAVAEAALCFAQEQVKAASLVREEAGRRASEAGLAASAASLRELASRVRQEEVARQMRADWEERAERIDSEIRGLSAALTSALNSAGAPASEDSFVRWERYRAECETRAAQAREATRRGGVSEALHAREALEAEALENERLRRSAVGRVQESSAALHFEGSPEAQVEQLQTWLTEYRQQQPEREAKWEDWRTLQDLLEDGTLDDLEDTASRARSLFERLKSGLDDAAIRAVDRGEQPEADLEIRRTDLQKLQADANQQAGAVDNTRASLSDIAEIEEAVVGAESELARVQQLDRTLELAIKFLGDAQDQIHRDISPILRTAVLESLPAVTNGRYTDVRIDAARLGVQVRDPEGRWRDASLLSHGASEQIYLLLRVGLAKHLTKPNETCPLVLDDVTVQCDSARKSAVLDLLHRMSGERQIILFSQEREVLDWSRSALGERDRLIELAAS